MRWSSLTRAERRTLDPARAEAERIRYNASNRRWRLRNPEYYAGWKAKHPEYHAQWRAANPSNRGEYMREWRVRLDAETAALNAAIGTPPPVAAGHDRPKA